MTRTPSHSPLPLETQESFLLSALRALGIVCAGTAGFSLAYSTGAYLLFKFPFTLYYSGLSAREWLPFIAEILALAVSVVLLIGGIGLVRWRPWSIAALKFYVVSEVALAVMRGINGIMATIALQTSPYADSKPPVLPTAILTLVATLRSCVWPAFIFYILSRAEVRNLWSRKHVGFEVLAA